MTLGVDQFPQLTQYKSDIFMKNRSLRIKSLTSRCELLYLKSGTHCILPIISADLWDNIISL